MGRRRVALVSSGSSLHDEVIESVVKPDMTIILNEASSSSINSIPRSYYGTIRGGSQHQQQNNGHRRTQDIEDMLQDMAGKDPTEWSPVEWFIMILFLSFVGWLGCCLCTLCCCGSRSSDICAWLCFWEICCRGGSDIDRCCDVYGPLAWWHCICNANFRKYQPIICMRSEHNKYAMFGLRRKMVIKSPDGNSSCCKARKQDVLNWLSNVV